MEEFNIEKFLISINHVNADDFPKSIGHTGK